MQEAISLIEFKVKMFKKDLNLNNANDKIKFLNNIAKLISQIDSIMEREVYIEKIAQTYDISKEAIYAQVNKIKYANKSGEKQLNKARPVVKHINLQENEVSEVVKNRENTILSILINKKLEAYKKLKDKITVQDFKYNLNKNILAKLYEEFEKGNSNINNILDNFDEQTRNHITMIMAYDLEIENVDKAINDILITYEKEKLETKKNQVIEQLENETNIDEKKKLEKELGNIIIQLAKIK